jgi:hypothetical protein
VCPSEQASQADSLEDEGPHDADADPIDPAPPQASLPDKGAAQQKQVEQEELRPVDVSREIPGYQRA